VQVAFTVLGQLIGQDEQAVKRRAQLVGHIGQELGFVFRGERQLLGFLFQGLPGLLNFGVFAFDFGVLLGEQFGFLLQFEVGLLQFLLPALKFFRQRLGLFEEILGTGVGLDGVEHDADRFDELIQERLVRGTEPLE